MNRISEIGLTTLLPHMIAWAERQERHLLSCGDALNQRGMEMARRAGVQRPAHVRLLPVTKLPLPEDLQLGEVARKLGFITSSSTGLTIGYAIFVCVQHWTDAKLVARELVYVAQYERCGTIAAFLQEYLRECNAYGYPRAPMVQAAIAFAQKEFPSSVDLNFRPPRP